MKNKFVKDGPLRFLIGKGKLASETIETKYARELKNASPAQKEEIRKKMAEEFLRREKALNHKPSPGTLW